MNQSERIAYRYLPAMKANPNDKRHGTATGYSYGCRCPKCKAASSARYTRHYSRSKRSMELAAKRSKPTMCVETREVFSSRTDAAQHEDTQVANICSAVTSGKPYRGKHWVDVVLYA